LNLDRLSDVYAVPVSVLEDEGAQTVIFILKAFDDAQSLSLTYSMKGIDVLYHHMSHIEGSRPVVWL